MANVQLQRKGTADVMMDDIEKRMNTIAKELSAMERDPKKLAAALKHASSSGSITAYDSPHPLNSAADMREKFQVLTNMEKDRSLTKEQIYRINALKGAVFGVEAKAQAIYDKSVQSSVPKKAAPLAKMSQSEAEAHDRLAIQFSDIKHNVSGILAPANLAEGAKAKARKEEGVAILSKAISQVGAFAKALDAAKGSPGTVFYSELGKMSAEAKAMLDALNERKAKLSKDAARLN